MAGHELGVITYMCKERRKYSPSMFWFVTIGEFEIVETECHEDKKDNYKTTQLQRYTLQNGVRSQDPPSDLFQFTLQSPGNQCLWSMFKIILTSGHHS